ncbi:5286_t:CDS:10 [Diversispora eburnea]|uniref:5286_t:CDS:1 n=1 Tax=Diversispora eburnea TaxID=1213867 RepID=A0A9N8UX38_9GLOM|nr:5286_t:CDS:10 [Diversispora eburnea]
MYNGLSVTSLLEVTRRSIKASTLPLYEDETVQGIVEGIFTLDQIIENSQNSVLGEQENSQTNINENRDQFNRLNRNVSENESMLSIEEEPLLSSSQLSRTSNHTIINSTSQNVTANQFIPRLIQNQDIKVLQLYHSYRLEKIKNSTIQDIPYSEDVWLNLSEEEKNFYKEYKELLENLKEKSPSIINLSANLIPPREALVVIRVISDIGELMTLNGFINFRKGTQIKVKKADPTVERLIKIGAIKIWEWSANPDQWIPFDLASAAELEDAYQKKKASISPKQGYFASIPDRYEIRFNYVTGRFQQHNMTSGGARRIRRVANDDNSILQPVPFENVTSEDCCIICLDNFEDENTSIEQEIVKLPPCHGHYFHRACVADELSDDVLALNIDNASYDESEVSELSEEEVFALNTENASEEEDDDDDSDKSEKESLSEDSSGSEDFEKFDASWGKSKRIYYDADEVSDLEEAREEEQEALRLYKKRISQMTEEDFLETNEYKANDNDKLSEQSNNKNFQISSDSLNEVQPEVLSKSRLATLSREGILNVIQNESPELIGLLNEFEEKLPLLQEMVSVLEKSRQRNMKNSPELKFLSMKYQLLIHYLKNISFYLVLKTSGTRNLREHPIIDALVDLRITLDKFERLESKVEEPIKSFINKLDQPDQPVEVLKQKKSTNTKKKKDKKKDKKKKVIKETKSQLVSINDHEEDDKISPILTQVEELQFISLKKSNKKRKLESTDFGDLNVMDEVDAEDKEQKRKSLRYYVSQIDQKLSKRDKAVIQGDNQDWNDDDTKVAMDIENKDDDDDFEEIYQSIKNSKKVKKDQRKVQFEEQNSKVIIHDETLPEGVKRQINYQILKNKGLKPSRKKEQRNPRVKHRQKFERAKKKIKSIKATFVQQEGSYGGEKTGIKTGLTRSVKFN